MGGEKSLTIALRRRRLVADSHGFLRWRPHEASCTVAASRTAVVLCDVWGRHWCRATNERLRLLRPRIQTLVETLREAGVPVVHAPSDTMPVYAGPLPDSAPWMVHRCRFPRRAHTRTNRCRSLPARRLRLS